MEEELDLQAQMKLANDLKMLENIAKQHMTKEAISRYGNLKIAHQDLAIKAIATIAQACQEGRIETLNDSQFKELLQAISGESRKNKIKIR